MASVQQGEKQLFEKFWKGTFKAVATPRPGSVIVASITSRKPLASTEALGCLSLPTDNKRPEEPRPAQETSSLNGCVRLKDSQEYARQKTRSSRSQLQKSQRRHHRRHSGSESTNSHSGKYGNRLRARSREEGRKGRWKHSRHSLKGAQKPHRAAELTPTPVLGCALQDNGFLPSTEATSASRSKGGPEPRCRVHDGLGHTFCSGKTSRGSSSDSGNSFTSCFSRTKGATLEDPTPSPPVRTKDRRSYSRSPSYSSKSCKRSPGSRSSRQRRSPSYARYSPIRDRDRDHKYGSSEKDSHRHCDRRRRKHSYSPMRKRRRDSPSHLEARRITSARKRPIPYYRPSPSSSSRSSVSSYSSSHSAFSHSPSRSYTYSSKRTSRSRSWSSGGGSSRSRSRSGSSSGARSSRRSSSRRSESAGSYDSLRH
ncbi:serine/arginine repetitive matrix protein 4 [Rhineura floridana]|uniref:serine/arginine repetitive matrix protein 4 n=1 Tax=Rhineura floridana TaxID=261503 RepID=UPI002AC832C5|nr:serine/arginine repetitive matrix protein 4 [Rhineura floridana]